MVVPAPYLSGSEERLLTAFEELRDMHVEIQRQQRELRSQWLKRVYPKEMWRVPNLAAQLIYEAGRCYVDESYYASIVICQAAIESALRLLVGTAYIREFKSLVENLCKTGRLQRNEKDELFWLADMRNPIIHPEHAMKMGEPSNLDKALKLDASAPSAIEGGVEREPLKSNCERALKALVGLIHSSFNAPDFSFDANFPFGE